MFGRIDECRRGCDKLMFQTNILYSPPMHIPTHKKKILNKVSIVVDFYHKLHPTPTTPAAPSLHSSVESFYDHEKGKYSWINGLPLHIVGSDRVLVHR